MEFTPKSLYIEKPELFFFLAHARKWERPEKSVYLCSLCGVLLLDFFVVVFWNLPYRTVIEEFVALEGR